MYIPHKSTRNRFESENHQVDDLDEISTTMTYVKEEITKLYDITKTRHINIESEIDKMIRLIDHIQGCVDVVNHFEKYSSEVRRP